MKGLFQKLILLLSIVFTITCVSLKFDSPPEPFNQLELFFFCENVQIKGDVLEAAEEKNKFFTNTKNICSFVKITDIDRQIRLRWKWYSPDKKLFRDTQEVTANVNNKYIAVLTAFDELKVSHNPKYEGLWTVVIYFNGRLAASKTFTLSQR